MVRTMACYLAMLAVLVAGVDGRRVLRSPNGGFSQKGVDFPGNDKGVIFPGDQKGGFFSGDQKGGVFPGGGQKGGIFPDNNIVNSELNTSALIYNELRGDESRIRNGIMGRLASTGSLKKVEELRMTVDAIVSNILVGDRNTVFNLIGSLVANVANIHNATVELETFAINDIMGDDNVVGNLGFYNLVGVNGGNNVLRDLFVDISSIGYNKIGGENDSGSVVEGEGNTLGNVQGIQALLGNVARSGPDTPITDLLSNADAVRNVTLLIDAILLNEVVSGSDNWLGNFMKIAALNGLSAEDAKVGIQTTLVNQVRGAGIDGAGNLNSLANVVDIALGLCDGRRCGSLKDFEAYVETILLNDVTGNDNVILNLVDIAAATQDGCEPGALNALRCRLFPPSLAFISKNALKDVVMDVEAIVVNTIGDLMDGNSDTNSLINSIKMDLLTNVKAEEVKLAVSAIVANKIQGDLNTIDNAIDIKVGNGATQFQRPVRFIGRQNGQP